MNDDQFNEIAPLPDGVGISSETQPMKEITDYLNNAGIDTSQFSQDNWNQLVASSLPDTLVGEEGNELPISGFDPTLLDDQSDQAQSGSEADDDSSTGNDTDQAARHQISFGAAGKCWWCGGSGVVWSGGENQPCSHCGGSGIGPT